MIRRRPTPRDYLRDLRPWPMLLGAIVFIAIAAFLSIRAGHADDLAQGFALLGAVLLGAWIAMLAISGYAGGDDDHHDDDAV